MSNQKTKQQKAVEFVEDFLKYGFRIDTMPTRMLPSTGNRAVLEAVHEEYHWWSMYVTDAQKRLRDVARKVLEEPQLVQLPDDDTNQVRYQLRAGDLKIGWSAKQTDDPVELAEILETIAKGLRGLADAEPYEFEDEVLPND